MKTSMKSLSLPSPSKRPRKAAPRASSSASRALGPRPEATDRSLPPSTRNPSWIGESSANEAGPSATSKAAATGERQARPKTHALPWVAA